MGEPWLDSLSEDWKSELRSSSPAPSLSSSRQYGSVALSRSQSRIPHLAQNMRKDSSSTGSFLRLRSKRGQARASAEAVLRERSASNLNVRRLSGSQKYNSLPRPPSSTFSDSQTSVQHYTVHEKPVSAETPEWKRRLANGEEIASDGFDLFSPSKLEGIFKQPTASQLHSDNDSDLPKENDSDSRKPFTLPASNPFTDQYSSYRGTRSRLNLEVLEEVNEDEEADRRSSFLVSSELGRSGSLKGLVRRRVESFELSEDMRSNQSSPRESSHRQSIKGYSLQDPRLRTISGQEEVRNEFISPVTISKQNSIRATAVQNTLEVDMPTLQKRLRNAAAAAGDADRPTSSSSDRNVSYASREELKEGEKDEPLPDLTSQSLPDDLSMGTQDFISHGGFINSRRGGRSNEASFLRKSLSLNQDSQIESGQPADLQFHSSPPLRPRRFDHSVEQSRFSSSSPTTPQESSVVHHTAADIGPSTAGSPLKLFGNRDTYTNNKLMRILSHFEDPDGSMDKSDASDLLEEQRGATFRMSQFGQGELDGFGFEQDVPRPSPIQPALVDKEDRIFKAVMDNLLEDEDVNEDDASTTSENPHQVEEPTNPAISEINRTSKRRKTLFKDATGVEAQGPELRLDLLEETGTLAGKKRKDARPGDDGIQADPEVLASRNLLRPRSARRSSSSRVPSGTASEVDDAEELLAEESEEDLAKALANELATFAEEAALNNDDSRKPSLATKDYMEEANKVMQFIRSRGKPKPALPDIDEPENVSELNPDAILDLEIDGDSTKDDFSRPPSRDRPIKPSQDRRHAHHDSTTANYLRRYQEDDELDALAGASVFGTFPATANLMAAEMAQLSPPGDQQESSPPNIRILDQSETMRKRKHSASTVDGPHEAHHDHELNTHQSSHNSTQNTFPTRSSTSGHKGVITSGTVSIPDNVGVMTFDHEKKIWVRKMYAQEEKRPTGGRPRQTGTEEDPFEDIPDLSIDEQRELETRDRRLQNDSNQKEDKNQGMTRFPFKDNTGTDHNPNLLGVERVVDEIDQSSLRSKASEHEEKLHNGVPSKPPAQLKEDRKQARVVTIAFSSPVVSAVNYAKLSEDDFDDLPREEDLPLDDSEIDLNYEKIPAKSKPNFMEQVQDILRTATQESVVEAARAVAFHPRTISPIEEHDEDQFDAERSLVHVQHPSALTPAPPRTIAKLQKAGNKASSILCLTPLSDFSVHQVDAAKNPDQSYVDERKHPNALRQAHGSMTLAVDALIKAITDAVPDELYWEQLRRMTFAPGSVSSTHNLKEYCPVLEEFNLPDNKVSQLRGLPRSLRVLDIHNNMLNDLTSWGHLQNLQYLDVSGNQLESLEGFASLVHLRSLKANNNQISRIDGILDLNGLLELELCDNDLTSVDFEGAELTRLKSLNLSHNQLEAVSNIDCLPELEDLNLSQNALSSFLTGGSERSLPLRTLRLSHNKLGEIDLEHMPSIQHLELDNNRIQDIHGLSSAYHLEILSLREQTESSDIIDLVLSTPNECRQIRLSSNPARNGTLKLPTIPQNNLRELEIAACGISELPEWFGASFPNCRHLNANFNGIKDVDTLRKMVHLKTLLLARNRIKKLRRTCLVLSRLGSLEQVDLRDNPLTVGFYSPMSTPKPLSEARYHLPNSSQMEDATWMKVLDEVTGLKRRMIELLLAEHCKKLVQLDGLSLCHSRLSDKDETWNKLTAQGVLLKPTQAPAPQEGEAEHAHEAENDKEGSSLNGGDVFDG